MRQRQRVRSLYILCLGMFLIAPRVHALSFTSFDARSMAMGGTGVASATPYNAVLFNPSLLTRDQSVTQRLYARPYLGARLIDRDNFLDSLDAFQQSDSKQRLDVALARFRSRAEQDLSSLEDVNEVLNLADDVVVSARDLLGDYQSLSDKPLRFAASAGLTTGLTEDRHAVSFILRRNQVGGAMIRVSNGDINAATRVLDTVDSLRDTVGLLVEGDALPLAAVLLNLAVNEQRLPRQDELTSSVVVEGARSTEAGLSYAPLKQQILGWNWGVTLKGVEFETVDFEQRVANANLDNFNSDEHASTHHDFNADLGFSRRLSPHWRLGAVIRNIVPYDYDTVRGNTIEIRPLARLGLAYERPCCTLTADLDLTRNDPLGFDPDKRYLGFGAEWRILSNTALRTGYRYNTVSGSGLYSVGIGLGSKYLHADLAAAAKGDELGISIQLAAYF